MIKGMKFEAVVFDLKVLSKDLVQGKPNDRGECPVYYNLTLEGPDRELGRVGCDLDTYNGVIVDKHYDFTFTLNTAYDKIYVRFNGFREATPSTSKK